MASKLKAGDVVRLNRNGMRSVFGYCGTTLISPDMTITSVAHESLTSPEKSYEVTVDNEEINQFIIVDYDFDLVRSA